MSPNNTNILGEIFDDTGTDNIIYVANLSDCIRGKILERVPRVREAGKVKKIYKKMQKSFNRIKQHKNRGVIPSWIMGIKPLGTEKRSEERGRLTVEKIEGINLGRYVSENRENSEGFRQTLVPIMLALLDAVTVMNIGTHSELNMFNMIVSENTLEKIKLAQKEGRQVELDDTDKVWINFDPDAWTFAS